MELFIKLLNITRNYGEIIYHSYFHSYIDKQLIHMTYLSLTLNLNFSKHRKNNDKVKQRLSTIYALLARFYLPF